MEDLGFPIAEITGIIILIGQFLIGWNEAVARAPIFAGASVALMIVNQTLTDLGLVDSIGVLVITIFATQKFIGVPLSIFCAIDKPAINLARPPSHVRAKKTGWRKSRHPVFIHLHDESVAVGDDPDAGAHCGGERDAL